MQKDLLSSFLHLFHCFGHKRRAFVTLLDYFHGNPVQVLEAGSSELIATGIKPEVLQAIRQPQHPAVKRDLTWAQQPGNHLLTYQNPAYPALLRQIDDFPLLLYARGSINLLHNPQIAIVGSRLCTPGGAQTAKDFATQLASGGLTITSGMAQGIDAQAHRGALCVGAPTIAVNGTGLDRIYPPGNASLAREILENGLLVSEFPLGSRANRHSFPQRNRIISGLSLATLVVEATGRSGSLITARLAAEQGREVFAVPGSIHNPQTRGCHRLIRDGAKLVEQVSDIIEDLGSLLGFMLEQQPVTPQQPAPKLDREQRNLLEAIGYDAVNIDTLVRRSGLTIDNLSSMLLVLELDNLIQSAPGGCFVRI